MGPVHTPGPPVQRGVVHAHVDRCVYTQTLFSNPNFIFSEKYKICVKIILTDFALLLCYTYWIELIRSVLH